MSILSRMIQGYIPMGQLPSYDLALPYAQMYNGQTYPLDGMNTTLGGQKTERIQGSFTGLVQGAYQKNGVVFAVELARLMLFSEARFQFQAMRKGRAGDYFGTPMLGILEHPWTGATTGDLLSRMLQYVDFGGDCFVVRGKGQIRCLRPDWVTMILGSQEDPSVDAVDPFAEIVGIVYQPGGFGSGKKAEIFLPGEFGHFAPIPDPLGFQRGMPWLLPIVAEIMGDEAATAHKLKFFENGATPNLVVNFDPSIPQEKFTKWISQFEEGHKGVLQAYKTLYMGGGATASTIGSNMQQMDFSAMQGRAEVRICIAGGVPATVVGVSEGLQGSSLNAGNFGSAMRHFADITMRPLWRNVAGSLESICPPPAGARLWYDDRDIPALKDDIKDAAEVLHQNVQSVTSLVRDGFTAKSAISAIISADLSQLEHTGLFSVQLQAPGSTKMPAGEVPGELPVGGAPGQTGPEDVPAGAVTTKPTATTPSMPMKPPPKKPRSAADALAPLTRKKAS